jgi:SAM-dependent methyltransferase
MYRRIGWLRLRNRFAKRQLGKEVQITSGPEKERELRAWLDKGYDKINLGGGRKTLSNFVNIDFLHHSSAQREIVANILDLSFVPSASLSHVHSNHVIEHLTDSDIVKQFEQYYRILKPGGIITIRCPNALGVAFGFWFKPIIESEKQHYIKVGFPPDEDFGNPLDTWFHKDFYGFLHWIFGDAGNVENQHLSIITPTKMMSWLRTNGFELLAISEPEAANLVVVARKISERALLHA